MDSPMALDLPNRCPEEAFELGFQRECSDGRDIDFRHVRRGSANLWP